ncbi:MAG: hypothetical protein OEZ47_01780 [Gammaproteobacteria bacterium]|nr:hypothetical protein [Gammaproteobacteria bacterium]
MIESIFEGELLLAIIVRREYSKPGITFFTENDLSQQLAYMNHPIGKVIAPHVHNPVPRKVDFTQEVLFIKSGSVRVDFYSSNRAYLQSSVLKVGDVILLAHGGHGFEMLEDCEMIEVKQGPYAGEADKTRFESVSAEDLKITEE